MERNGQPNLFQQATRRVAACLLRNCRKIGAATVMGAYAIALQDVYLGASPLGWDLPSQLVLAASMVVGLVTFPIILLWSAVGMVIFGFDSDHVAFVDMTDTTVPAAASFLMTLSGWFIWGRIIKGDVHPVCSSME